MDKCDEEAQSNDAVTGHLASAVVDAVFKRLSQSQKLHARFSPALQRNQKMDSSVEKCLAQYKNKETASDIKGTQEMLQEIMQVMNRIIENQIKKRTCVTIPRPLKSFLVYLTRRTKQTEEYGLSEGYPLAGAKSLPKLPDVEDQGDFLFNVSRHGAQDAHAGQQPTPTPRPKPCEVLMKKIRLVRRLLKKYDHLSKEQKVKAEDVHTYLVKHLAVLQEMLKNMQKKSNTTKPADADKATSSSPATHDAAGESKPKSGHAARETRGESYEADADDESAQLFDDADGPSVSDKYKKLVETAEYYRRKRHTEQQLGNLFSHSVKRKRKSSENL